MSSNFQLPLLHDHHSHPMLYASFGSALSLENVSRKSAAVELLKNYQARQSPGLSLVYGWRSNEFQWTPAELDEFGPLAIFNLSLHSLLLNKTGAKILRKRFGDDVDRVSNQIWYENNFRRVLNWFANLNASPASLKEFFDHLLSLGVYSVEELLLVDENEIELFRETGLISRTKFWSDLDTFDSLSPAAQDQVTGIKLFTDGALGARTAAMSESYQDAPGNVGMLVYTDKQIERVINESLDRKDSLAVHAIGDVAIKQVVAALEKVKRVTSAKTIRIEHAQMIDLETALHCKSLGVTLSMQPNFNNDSIHYRDRLNEHFCRMNNPFRMLIDDAGFIPGEDLIFGSDGMPHGIESAAGQCFLTGLDSQRISVEEFTAAYCLNDNSMGTIELTVDDDVKFEVKTEG
jgi:predicted amidohydrolase YtcJ